jgi:hypothetical protein
MRAGKGEPTPFSGQHARVRGRSFVRVENRMQTIHHNRMYELVVLHNSHHNHNPETPSHQSKIAPPNPKQQGVTTQTANPPALPLDSTRPPNEISNEGTRTANAMPSCASRKKNAIAALVLLAIAKQPLACVAGELTLDQMPNSDNLFGGDIIAEYHQIRTAFGEATAQAALTDKAVTYDASLDTPSARRLGAFDGATLWRGGVVSYVVDDSYKDTSLAGGPTDFRLLQDAMTEITTKTGITFRQRQGSESYIRIVGHTGCKSGKLL